MNDILINYTIPVNSQPLEIVERKGIGHPDTIADGLAEVASIEYSLHCLRKFGAILHHHFDKILIMGGKAKINFGEGEMEKPIRLIVNGRISSQFGNTKIDYKKILENASKKYLKNVLPSLDVEKWLKIQFSTTSYSRSPIWYHPKDLDDLPELKRPYASDTAAIVGYWPLSTIERLVLKLERFFYNPDNTPKFKYIGQDIKILAKRDKKNIDITMCIPFLSTKTPNKIFYQKNLENLKSQLLDLAQKFTNRKFNINLYLNTADINLFRDSKKDIGYYLVFSGSALDYGEEGVAGRGNRSRGLISCIRPFSTDAILGKNPTFHIGKVYAYFAEEIAKIISEELKCECTVILLTQNRRFINSPLNVIVNVTRKKCKRKIEAIIKEELNKKDWIEKIVKNKYFLPLPGGTYGYQES